MKNYTSTPVHRLLRNKPPEKFVQTSFAQKLQFISHIFSLTVKAHVHSVTHGQDVNSVANLAFVITENWKKVRPGDCRTDNRKWQYGLQNRKYITYIPGTITDRIEIQRKIWGFLFTASSIKVCPNSFDNNRHTEIGIVAVLMIIKQFPVIRCCRNHLPTLLSSSSWSKIRDLSLELRRYLS